jgi:hypothetical protein
VPAVNVSAFSDRVIDPIVTVWPIQPAPGGRWKMFLASATGLDRQTRPNPSSILAKRWANQRIANPDINSDLSQNSQLPHSLASAVHLSDRRPDMGRSVGFL